MSTTPTPLTRESYLKMSTEELRNIVRDPAKLAEVNAILNESEPVIVQAPPVEEVVAGGEMPTPEDIAAAEAAKVEADRLAEEETSRQAEAKAAQEDAYKAAGVTVETDSNGNITKIIKTYQARDEAGNPIGRPTYLEAKDWLELSIKQQSAHEHAVRYGERVKKQQTTKKKDSPAPQTLSEAELLQLQEELKGEDRDAAAKAAEKIRHDDEQKRYAEAQQTIENARQAQVSYRFLAKHVADYNNCEANNKLIDDYIKDNLLEWTENNLEAALIAVESQLAPKELPAPTAPANPVPVTPAPAAPPPAAEATPAPPVAPNLPAPPAPRPGVNAGIVPGSSSAPRPTSQPKGLTKADIKAMSREEYKRRLKDPKFVSEVNALLARR